MDILIVSHFHWDREWYRTFDEFRGRLVDAIDDVLDLLDDDPEFCFVLDGQAVVLEDYLEVRPHQRGRIEAAVRARRLAVGPWYVQPDSLLPSGEAHVRNLLHGRAVAGAFGPVSTTAYVPDSFGHPAQFPQLFAGFGLDPFVYWRGNAADTGGCYRWRGPDGSTVRAWYLAEGYFSAGGLDADEDPDATAERLRPVIERIASAGEPVLLMNGFDHLPPDHRTTRVAAALGARRVLLDDAARSLPRAETLPERQGPLTGARSTNLLPGVWSARMPLKLRNRRIEHLLTAWTEPWSAFGALLGCADERPALARAWRSLLQNQAHDSIGGCSVDAVHERMQARYDDAEGLGRAVLSRVLEHLAGRARTRPTPWSEDQHLVVFNASPHTRTDVVRVPLEGFPPWRISAGRFDIHPLAMPSFRGLTADGLPARVVPSDDPARVRFLPGVGGLDIELVVADVPAFGCVGIILQPADSVPDVVDDGREISAGDVRVSAGADGTFDIEFGARRWQGLFGIEDARDDGDSYDTDPHPRDVEVRVREVRRSRHPSGIERLVVAREIDEVGTLTLEATVARGVPFVRVRAELDHRGRDHRLRVRFPTGSPIETFDAATTFDVARRSVEPPDDAAWVHPAPRTFVQHGFVAANDLVVGAPGLPEAEVTPDGDILVTLVRSVGALSRIAVATRPLPAGPEMPAPGAQVRGVVVAEFVITADARHVRDAETGFVGVLGGPEPRLAAATSLVRLDAERCVLSACKPPEEGDGVIVRLLNPTDDDETALLTAGFDLAGADPVRLDESPADDEVRVEGRAVRIRVPAHALRSVRLRQVLRR